MIPELAEQYRVAAIHSFTEELLGKREKTITAILAKKKLHWFLDCIRLYLKKTIQDETFLTDFIKAFQDEDNLFENDGNRLELRVLAGAVIREYLKKRKDKNDDRILVALALITCKFSMAHASIINIDIVEQAYNFLTQEAKQRRNAKELRPLSVEDFSLFSSQSADINQTDIFLKDFSHRFQGFIKNFVSNDLALKRKIFVLEEESDIHWWLFKKRSSLLDKHLSAIDANIGPLAIALELSKLTRISPPPANYMEFIKNAFSNIANADNISVPIVEIIKSSHQSQLFPKNEQADSDITTYKNLTPLLFALMKAEESGGDPGWTAVFKLATNCESDESLPLIEFAKQLYLELLLVKPPVEY